MQKSVTVKSLSQFVQKVTTINLKSEITLLPPTLLFRGHSDKNYSLTPSLIRPVNEQWHTTLQFLEVNLIQLAQEKYPTLFSGTDIPIILLAKMQHYGIPTRLIDLTSNALVALYFACSGNQDRDGEVLAFSADVCSAYNPYVNAIADTYRLTNNSIMDVQTYYHRVKQQGYFSNATYPDSSDKTNLCLDNFLQMVSKPIFVETGNICERQKMQSGYFLLFPNRVMKKKEITNTIIENDKVQKHVVKRIIVPAEYKKEILEGLRILGISEETLFSDNPDIVMRNITRNLRSRYH